MIGEKSPLHSKPLNGRFYRLGYIKCAATNGVELTAMMAFLKRMRWVALLACYVVIARTCRLFRIALPMDSFWRPHNLRRFGHMLVLRVPCVISGLCRRDVVNDSCSLSWRNQTDDKSRLRSKPPQNV